MECDKKDETMQIDADVGKVENPMEQTMKEIEDKVLNVPDVAMSATTLVAKVLADVAVDETTEKNNAEPQQSQLTAENLMETECTNAMENKESLVLVQSPSTIFEQSFESAKSLNDSIISKVLPEYIEALEINIETKTDNIEVAPMVNQEIEPLAESIVVSAVESIIESGVNSNEIAKDHQENNTVTKCQDSDSKTNSDLQAKSDLRVKDSGVSAPLTEQITNQVEDIINITQIIHENQTEEISINSIEKEINAKNSQLEKEVPMDAIVEMQEKSAAVIAVNEEPTASKISEAPTGLSLLAQYGSDNDGDNDDDVEKISDTDSVIEVPTGNNNLDYRKKVVEIASDSDESSDSSGSDVGYLDEIRKSIEKSIDVEAVDDDDDADDDEHSGKTRRQPPRVKGEFLIDDLPPIQDLHITVPEEECIELGKVHSIVDQLVLVNALPNAVLLDLETVLFFDKGQRVLGEVFDVLGQVADPLYCVRFNSNKQIKEKNIKIGEVVYVAPKTQYTQFVILSNLMKMRGSDASWENDIEPPPRYLDYSDDEQEREARSRRRNKDRPYEHIDLTKRTRSDVDCKMESPSPSQSPSPTPPQQHHHHNQRRLPLYLRGRDGPRSQRYQQHQNDFRSNYNSNSWHSNYPQHYRGSMQPPNFAPSPHAPFNATYPPPNYGAYPPPQGMPMHPPPPQQGQQPPMYVLNPYAVRAPVPMYLSQPPPPPPPGAQ